MRDCDRIATCKRITRCSGCPKGNHYEKIGDLTKDTFIGIASECQKLLKHIIKIEEAFGGIVLESFSQYPCNIINTLERSSGVNWMDEIFDIIYNECIVINDCKEERTLEDAWKLIEKEFVKKK